VLSAAGAVLALVLAACGSSGSKSGGDGGGGSGASGSTLTIAISAPFTGPTADYGTEAKHALQLAEKYYGSTINGHPLKVVTFDDKCTGSGAEVAIKNALAQHPILIDGPACSGGVSAVQKTITDAGVPEVVGSYLPSLTENGANQFFRGVPSDAQFAATMATFIQKQGFKKVAILHGTAAFSAGEGVALDAALKAVNLAPVKNIAYTDGATDFSGAIESLKSAKPDAVFFASYDPDGARACAQMKQLGLDAACLGNESLAYADSAAAGGASLNGAYAWGVLIPSELPDFTAAWKKEFGTLPNDESYGLGYLGFAVALQAIKAAGPNPTPQKVAELMHSTTFDVNLGIGKVKFDEKGNNSCVRMYIGQLADNGKTFKMLEDNSLKC
jgi:branched-chain amino acid transport system substrate-binding protein